MSEQKVPAPVSFPSVTLAPGAGIPRAATAVSALPGSNPDPLWFKDAIIYELHVKAFQDGNNDGIGDFQGLMQRLDYLESLGVTAIWLLPFFPSPLRDDGYDIADYKNIHPSYGTLEDFQQFLDAAHERGLQVIIELVINHTSDQHPWFQRARNSPIGSPERDFYVWSDSDKLYQDARIIFTDTEKSNWTYDPVAKQYYWHRFFSHQPDVNFDNPQVLAEMLDVLRFWLDKGVDGVRLDAIPYLVERDGTNCENLPETHTLIKAIRAAMDEQYTGRMILAEANQWPADVRPYFGDGDECHMAFHFPLMPRIYMALRQEDTLPITDIMAQTPDLPDSCQWGLFLRNHDELTLEMVTDDERDYMYLAYSADPRMRINVGIRRRLAPLLDNNRRRIELLNALLFSFPGTPILYYGDEIGMGDNIYLGDRNGVRTPMQWSGDRNAGFSRTVPARLYSPVVMDPVFGYEAINVEAQQEDSSSLLHWMRNMIALRKLFRVFGRGTQRFLHPSNRKVLAYVRQMGDEIVLCVANLSRFAQPVELDLKEFAGLVPVEMLGYVEFPPIRNEGYPLTLGPYGFLWLELHVAAKSDDTAASPDRIYIGSASDWESLFASPNLQLLQEQILPRYLQRQRWFGAKARKILSVNVLDWGEMPGCSGVLALLGVQSAGGVQDRYQVPLVMLEDAPEDAILARVQTAQGEAILADATYDSACGGALLRMALDGESASTHAGCVTGCPARQAKSAQERPASRRSTAEQSNTSLVFGSRYMLKLFRRPEPGPNPDVEIGRYLAEQSDFRSTAPFLSSLEYKRSTADARESASQPDQHTTLALLQGLVANDGDGWEWFLRELEHSSGDAADASTLGAAESLGRLTADLHAALGRDTPDEAFSPQPVTEEYLQTTRENVERQAADVLQLLQQKLPELKDSARSDAEALLQMDAITRTLQQELSSAASGLRTRIHGDYHLGQTLRTGDSFILLDFEGEPARPLEERRRKYSPLKDVAGMLRSFSYVAVAAQRSSAAQDAAARAVKWEAEAARRFVQAYKERLAGSAVLPDSDQAFEAQLRLFLLEKAFYELQYELNNRPTWVAIPLRGLVQLLRGKDPA